MIHTPVHSPAASKASNSKYECLIISQLPPCNMELNDDGSFTGVSVIHWGAMCGAGGNRFDPFWRYIIRDDPLPNSSDNTQ